MDKLVPRRFVVLLNCCNTIRDIETFDRNDAIRSLWQNAAGHDLDAVFRFRQCHYGVAGMLRALDFKTPPAAFPGIEVERNAIHGHAIEWWLVAFRRNILAQDAAASIAKRHRENFTGRNSFCDRAGCFGHGQHASISGLPGQWPDDQCRADSKRRPS